jgi:hypothetical protein
MQITSQLGPTPVSYEAKINILNQYSLKFKNMQIMTLSLAHSTRKWEGIFLQGDTKGI